ncbi:competence type IV pilus minor pilin ComGF [Vagococcus elongatus]|uniref:Prepilin-type cleavage/methylation domain-containing protein n=1 Tax=Vagococcus elongatus TaxID=180344 RepID=A0A430B140_9ENTE|nr:competence type IV pilus minor pilin ComGF [Vagococcus elongatus]RSU14034.1 hypothetical protein CBF29_03885 [Vagococcus elongatus]
MNKQNYQGFTLLEALVALLVLLLTCSFFVGLIRGTQQLIHDDGAQNHMEWHLFLNQLTHELTNLTLVEVGEDYLKLIEKGPKNEIYRTTIELYYRRQMIRKSTNGGHQPLLLHVRKAKFKEVATGVIEINVELLDGEKRQGRIRHEKKQEP